MVCHDYLCGPEHIAGAGIVPESSVIREELLIRCGGERFHRRETSEDFIVIAYNPFRLRLLEEYLRKPNMVAEVFSGEMEIRSPREGMPAVCFRPVEEG